MKSTPLSFVKFLKVAIETWLHLPAFFKESTVGVIFYSELHLYYLHSQSCISEHTLGLTHVWYTNLVA